MYGKALDNPKHTAKNCIFNTIFKCEQFFRIANLKLFICDVLRSISQNSTLKRAALFEPQTSTFINTGSRPENLQVCCGIHPHYAAGHTRIILRDMPALRVTPPLLMSCCSTPFLTSLTGDFLYRQVLFLPQA